MPSLSACKWVLKVAQYRYSYANNTGFVSDALGTTKLWYCALIWLCGCSFIVQFLNQRACDDNFDEG